MTWWQWGLSGLGVVALVAAIYAGIVIYALLHSQ